MRKCFAISLLAALALQLGACSGDDAFETPGAGGPVADVTAVSVLVSSPQLLSDDSAPVNVTVRVLNSLNQAVSDVPVTIQASSGVLTDIEATTGAAGTASAILRNSADLSNRQITITASAGSATDTVVVDVTGTRLSVQSQAAIVIGSDIDSTVTLLDAGGKGIANETVTVASSAGNGLSATSLTTDVSGQAVVTISGTVPGNDTITFTALGLTANQQVNVSNDSFAFVTPAQNAEIFLDDVSTGAVENLTVLRVDWSLNSVPQANEDINFSTTRGVLYQHNGSACTSTVQTGAVQTNASGTARACIAAGNAGPAIVTATTDDGTTAQRQIEFVADTPDAMNLQASPTSVATSGTSTITAVVRDAANNLVKNQTVVFTLTDTTGGSLSVGTAATDSQGRAQTVYTASSTTSASNGVRIDAVVQGTSVSATTTLTVARQPLSISLGTGNELEEPNPAQYSVPYAIQVIDVNGGGAAAGVQLTVKVVSLWYATGVWAKPTDGWEIFYTDVCQDEDTVLGAGSTFRNGILDPGEDLNGSGRLEAGNIATVTPAVVTTNEDGFAFVDVVYPQEYAQWVRVELSAETSVQGTESIRIVQFVLPILAADVADEEVTPPGVISPFGTEDYGCSDPPNAPLNPRPIPNPDP
jgi:hypothetical protein